MEVQISKIRVTDRIRKDNGDIEILAKSIEVHGLVNPITLMESEDDYVLIAGFRRLSAIKMLSREVIQATILSPMGAEEQLRLEIEENENRKDFTDSERVEYAEKLSVIEKEKARERMIEGGRAVHSHQGMDRGPYPEKGTTRDVIAKKVGYKSGRQLDRATYVAKYRPDLMAQIDAGEKSITSAYEEAKGIERKPSEQPKFPSPKEMRTIGIINGKLGHVGEEFKRENGFPYIFSEISSASEYFLCEIQMAASHYTQEMQSAANSQSIYDLLKKTLMSAAEAFGMNLKED